MKTLVTAVAVLCGCAAAQAAYLDGTNVTLRYELSGLAMSPTADPLTVGAGIEVTCAGSVLAAREVCSALTQPTQTLDFADTSITYLFVAAVGASPSATFSSLTPNRFVFDDLDEPGFVLAGVSISSPVDFTGRLSFDTKSVTLDMQSLVFSSQTGFTLNLQFRDVGQVPAPATALLAGLALAGLAVQRRRVS